MPASLHVYEPSGKSFLDVAAGLQLCGDLSEVAPNGVNRKGSAAIVQESDRKPGRLYRQRHDQSPRLRLSWNSTLDRGGVVVGNTVEITIDAEAILQEE